MINAIRLLIAAVQQSENLEVFTYGDVRVTKQTHQNMKSLYQELLMQTPDNIQVSRQTAFILWVTLQLAAGDLTQPIPWSVVKEYAKNTLDKAINPTTREEQINFFKLLRDLLKSFKTFYESEKPSEEEQKTMSKEEWEESLRRYYEIDEVPNTVSFDNFITGTVLNDVLTAIADKK